LPAPSAQTHKQTNKNKQHSEIYENYSWKCGFTYSSPGPNPRAVCIPENKKSPLLPENVYKKINTKINKKNKESWSFNHKIPFPYEEGLYACQITH
jgi:hypothetical protein